MGTSNSTRKLRAFDFFCGAGGLTRGLLDAGIKVIAGFDIDEECRDTYQSNNRGVKFITSNIMNITIQYLKKFAKEEPLNEMLFAACAPCQPFSSHIKGGNSVFDATLLGSFARLVRTAKPRFVLVENVPGISRVRGNSTFRRFLRILENNGYNYAFGTLNAKYYGVPQNRLRLVLIAARGINVNLPRPMFGPNLKPLNTVRHAIKKFPAIKAGQSHPTIPNHKAASITPINIERLKKTPHNGGARKSWPSDLKLTCHNKNGDHCYPDVYGRMSWDKPAPTLTGRCHSITNGRYGHPVQNRAISLREAAALQTFPDNYVFYGCMKNVALQIGNAVPVLFARELGSYIVSLSKQRILSFSKGGATGAKMGASPASI